MSALQNRRPEVSIFAKNTFTVALLLSALTTSFSSQAARAERPTIIVLELTSQGRSVGTETTQTVGSLLPTYVGQDHRFKVRSGGELREMVKLETEKQLVGCEDNSCLAELSQALGARFVLFGNIGKLGSLIIINLALYDNVTGEAAGRQTLQAKRLEDLPAQLENGVRDLLQSVHIDGDGEVGGPPAVGSAAPVEGRKKTSREEFNDSVLVYNAAGNPFADSVFDFLIPEIAAFQGQSSTPLSPNDFYSAIGREELASSYRFANTLRYGLLLGGSTMFVVGGVGVLATIVASTDNNNQLFHSGEPLYYVGLIGGIVLILVGGAAVSWGIAQNPHPVTTAERKRLTEEHNRLLRRRLNVRQEQKKRGALFARLDPLAFDAE